jgi:hypothetical protein
MASESRDSPSPLPGIPDESQMDPFDPALLVEANALFPHAAERQVADLLSKAEKDLDLFDLEIIRMKCMLRQAELERVQNAKQIFQYHAVLAPYKRLPVEVWSKIFLLFQEEEESIDDTFRTVIPPQPGTPW